MFTSYQTSGFAVRRVAVEHRERYLIVTASSDYDAEVAGKKVQEQVRAANIDTIFLVQRLDDNFIPLHEP